MDRSASGGCVLGAEKGRLDANVGLLAGLGKGRQPRQQHFIGEERRHIQPDDGASVANLKLLGDRFELRENVVDVLEVVPAGIGQLERAHSALEQGDAELLLQRLDLMAYGRRSDEQFLGRRLEALQLGRDLKGLQKLERRQAHSQPILEWGVIYRSGPLRHGAVILHHEAEATFVPDAERPEFAGRDLGCSLAAAFASVDRPAPPDSSARNVSNEPAGFACRTNLPRPRTQKSIRVVMRLLRSLL